MSASRRKLKPSHEVHCQGRICLAQAFEAENSTGSQSRITGPCKLYFAALKMR